MEIKPGDLAVTRNPKLLGKIVSWFQTKEDDGGRPTWANHAMCAGWDGNDVRFASMEPIWSKWRNADEFDLIRVYRPHELTWPDGTSLELTDNYRNALGVAAAEFVPRFYGFSKIALHAIGLQRFCFLDAFPICSYAAVQPYSKVLGFNYWQVNGEWKSARSLDPDDLCDALEQMGAERIV